MQIEITPFYAGLLGLLLMVLSFRISLLRRKHRVSLGDGGHKDLHSAIRVQGNFVEYVPLTLVLLVLVELSGWPGALVHALGAALFIARVLHAQGMASRSGKPAFGRVAGIVVTWTVMVIASVLLIIGTFIGS